MINPSWEHEQQYWDQNIALIAGIDEVGMGALAGPVVAAAVVFSREFPISNFEFPVIRDSKLLSATQRERANTFIKNNAQAWAIGEASVEEISRLNIRKASHLAMQRAIDKLNIAPELLLIDGTPAQIHPTIPAINIIDGDAQCFSIAAASILAKVHRDQLMIKLDKKFPAYGFASHKGYGSKAHLTALFSLGITPYHRRTYSPVAKLIKT